MKRMIRNVSSILLVLVMLLSMSITVFSADSVITFKSYEDGWEMSSGSEFSATDLFDAFKGAMPGDHLTEIITIENDADDCSYINVYIRVEPGQDESMKEFLAQLTLRIFNGTQKIYESSPDQPGALVDNVFLGSIRKDESLNLTVELDVPIEMGNEFANAVGEVDWILLAECIELEQLTVHKIWDDNGDPNRPEAVTVKLLRDGSVHETLELSEANLWTHTWNDLDDRFVWTVEEVVLEGYESSYKMVDNTVFITNSNDYEPVPAPGPIDLSVKKEWSGSADKDDVLPEYVTVTLYNGDVAAEKITLNAENLWTYTWENLDGSGNWFVLESGIPKGYTPSYSSRGGTIIVTNTATLIQTGQINWPIPVLGGLGILMVLFGVVVMCRKRKNENA